jgi:hypothetical protein
MKKILVFAGAVVLAIFAAGGVASGAGEVLGGKKTETHTVAAPVRSIVLDVGVGDVELVRGADHVSVRETRHWGLKKPHVTRDVRDGVLTVKAHCPGGWFSHCSTNLRVSVPEGVAVQVRNGVGDVTGRGLLVRDADLKTNVGDVDLRFASAPSNLRAESDVGDVSLVVPRGTYAVDTQVDGGDERVSDLVQDGRAPLHITAVTNVGDMSISGQGK